MPLIDPQPQKVVTKANVAAGAVTAFLTREGEEIIGVGDGEKMSLFIAKTLPTGAKIFAKEAIEKVGATGLVEGAVLPLTVAYSAVDVTHAYDKADTTGGQLAAKIGVDGGATVLAANSGRIWNAFQAMRGAGTAAETGTALAEGTVAAEGTAATVETGTAIAAGEAGGGLALGSAAVVAAPIVLSGVFLYRDIKINNLRTKAEQDIDAIHTDTKSYSNLRSIVTPTTGQDGHQHSFRETVETYKQAIEKQGASHPLTDAQKTFLKSDFAWKGDTVDVTDPKNATALRSYMEVQREDVKQRTFKYDQLGTLPDGALSQGKLVEYLAAKKAQRTFDTAESELRTMQIRAAAPTVKPPSEIASVPKDIMNSPDSHTYTYVIKPNTSSVSKTDDRFPAPSREVLDTYAKTKGPVVEILYKEEHGKKVPYAANVYSIMDLNDPVASRRQAMASTMSSVYQGPMETPEVNRKSTAKSTPASNTHT